MHRLSGVPDVFAWGLQSQIARELGVCRATICKDFRHLLRESHGRRPKGERRMPTRTGQTSPDFTAEVFDKMKAERMACARLNITLDELWRRRAAGERI
jgi:hypothetical protein